MPPELWQVLAVAASALTAWVAWVKAVAPAFHWVSSVKDRMDDQYGEAARPGVPARPGMMQRLAETDLAVAEIKAAIPGLTAALQEIQDRDAIRAEAIRDIQYHVQPNHGESAYDAMGKKVDAVAKQIEGSVDGLRGEVRQLRADHAGRITRLEEHEDKESA